MQGPERDASVNYLSRLHDISESTITCTRIHSKTSNIQLIGKRMSKSSIEPKNRRNSGKTLKTHSENGDLNSDHTQLKSVVDRLAIEDVYGRLCRAMDRQDFELMKSCFFEDSYLEYGFFSMKASDFIDAGSRNAAAGFAVISHQIASNKYVEIIGNKALVECYVTGTHQLHHEASEYHMIIGARYVDRHECRNGSWRIVHRQPIFDWAKTVQITTRWPGPDDTPKLAWGVAPPQNKLVWGRSSTEDESYALFQSFRDLASQGDRN